MPPLNVACELLDLPARRIRLKISDEVGCPAVCGFWRPTILVPQRLLGRLDGEQLQLVFVHELTHWKRWDLQLNLLQTVLQVVYFYNPAVWFANFVLRRLREEAVDDAVLVALAAPVERYSHTLIDVAEHAARPLELNVRLIGILESRKALANRIQRLATSPLPKSARLGLWGFAAIAVIGLALLPMAGSRRLVAQNPAEKPAPPSANPPAASPPTDRSDSSEPAIREVAPVLAGRITDESGQPVSGAIVQVMNMANRAVQNAATNRDGHYAFGRGWFTGEQAIFIYSDRCLGFTRLGDCPRVVLDPNMPVIRDFRLKIACQLRVQTFDEEGHPVQGVQLFKAERDYLHQSETDHQGWMTVGGLVPAEYVLALAKKDFVPTLLIVKIEAPKTILERKVLLKRGVAIKGTSFYSDGKPVEGGRVVAIPSWWQSNWHPFGEEVKADGTFVLPHIGTGRYDVTLTVPGRSELWPRLDHIDLVGEAKPLSLNIKSPSPGPMVLIKGHLHFIGGKPRRSLWITADSSDRSRTTDRKFDPARTDEFEVGPLPTGKYDLMFHSPEIEVKRVKGVTAPTDDLQVDIHVSGQIALHGSVVVSGAKGSQPATDFRIRAIKMRNLRGSRNRPREDWQRIYDPMGEFTVELPGPGIYAVEVTADGFATVRSETINTDSLPKEAIRITLSKGVSLAGTVVDEEGRPIDGAIIMSLAKGDGQLPQSLGQSGGEEIGVRSVAGRFQFDGLSPGTDTFQGLHRDYALTTVRNVAIPADGQGTLAIVMKRGGTVCGHVHDERGRLLPGVRLQFKSDPGHFAGERYHSGYASAVTDSNGYYEVRHLPEQVVHILRDDFDRSPGVAHRAVLPANGKTRTVDFGAGPTISGRLFINGVPRPSTRLLLSDEDADWTDFRALAMTDENGDFAFKGVPYGTRYLYFSARQSMWGDEWVRVRALDVNTAAHNLGRVDHHVATVTVKVVGRPNDDTPVSLYFYGPNLFQVHLAADERRPRATGGPYVFENVAPGKYDVGLSGVPIVITPEEPNPTVTVQWPKGTASIRGTIDAPLQKLNGVFRLVSANVPWSRNVAIDTSGRFELRGIPSGEYSLILQRIRSSAFVPVVVKDFRLADEETKTLDFTKAALPPSELAKEVVQVSVFTPEGIPLTGCDIRLAGPAGQRALPIPTRSQWARKWFALPPGSYTFVASYLGAESAPQTVEVKPVLKDGTWITQDHAVNLTVTPIE